MRGIRSVFICDYVRTPIGRFGGSLSSVRTDDLAATPIAALKSRNGGVDWEALDDVILGCANQAGEDNRNVARMAALLAGLPHSVPGVTVNRLCGSGMDASLMAARAIAANEAEIVIAGGVESMSRAPFVVPKADVAFSRRADIYDTTIGWRFVNPVMQAQYGSESMPETAENVASSFNISRQDQDLFALGSQIKAAAAVASGRIGAEIVPVAIVGRKGVISEVNTDEHIRRDTTLASLSRLPTPFRRDGSVTAGNSSGINDGAAAMLLASEDAVKRYGLTPLARIVAGAVAGVVPGMMGMGPVPAIRKLCARTGHAISDFDVIELNEAFAAQVLAVLRELGLADDSPEVNCNGGAIAFGHPLGMSGARLVGTAALELTLTKNLRALSAMCVGVGQGIAVALERC